MIRKRNLTSVFMSKYSKRDHNNILKGQWHFVSIELSKHRGADLKIVQKTFSTWNSKTIPELVNFKQGF